MARIIRYIGLLLLPALFFIVACSQPIEPTPTQPAQPVLKKITLDDSATVLDLLPLLPIGFEHLDAASEVMSNKDLGLGPVFSEISEVEVFLNKEPYQLIFAYLGISESLIEQAVVDIFLKDDEMVESMIIEALKVGAAEEGIDEFDAVVDITHPQLGDLAALGIGTISVFGVDSGYDMLIFKINKVYVYIISMYLSEDKHPLLPIGEKIEHRIGMYSQ